MAEQSSKQDVLRCPSCNWMGPDPVQADGGPAYAIIFGLVCTALGAALVWRWSGGGIPLALGILSLVYGISRAARGDKTPRCPKCNSHLVAGPS